MNKLQKVQEALEFFARLDSYCAELKGEGARPKFDFKHTPVHDKGHDIAKEALAELKEFRQRLDSEELVDKVEVAIAEEFMLIPKESTWEEYAERLAQAAINTMKEYK